MVKEKHPVWSNKEITPRRIEPSSGAMTVEQGRLDSMLGQRLLVWSWYQVGDYQTSHPVVVKVAEALRRIFTGRRDGAVIAVATPVHAGREDAAAEVLEGFIADMAPRIDTAIERALAAPAP
jgi:EpsI family protein